MMQVHLREMPRCGFDHRCLPAIFSTIAPQEKVKLLHHQEGWVAVDEVNFYLRMIQTTETARAVDVMVLQSATLDEEIEPMLQRWMCHIAPFDAPQGVLVTGLLIEQHWYPVAIQLQAGRARVFTTSGGRDWLLIATRALGHHITLHQVGIDTTTVVSRSLAG